VFATLAYRRFNRIDTWQNCFEKELEGPEWNNAMLDRIEVLLREMSANSPVFTGAFWVCGYGSSPGHDKIAKMINFLKTDLASRNAQRFSEQLRQNNTTGAMYHRALQTIDGIGPFLAYEVYSDLIYSGLMGFSEDSWANPGPGAQKGLDLVFPGRRDYVQAMYDLRDQQQVAFKKIGVMFENVALQKPDGSPHWLTMRNIEHNLCEYSKYARGKARARFENHGDDLYRREPA